MDKDLGARLFRFAVNTIYHLRTIHRTEETMALTQQRVRSSGSAGANYEETQAGSSRADFRYKILITLREMRESNYWLSILKEIQIDKNEETTRLIQESEELKKILGSIASKLR